MCAQNSWPAQRLTMDWAVSWSNPGVGEIFRTCPNWPWGLGVFCTKVMGLFPWHRVAGTSPWQPTPSSTEFKEKTAVSLFLLLALMAGYRLNFTFTFSHKITFAKAAFFCVNAAKFGVMCKASLLPYKSHVGLYWYTFGKVKGNIHPQNRPLRPRGGAEV